MVGSFRLVVALGSAALAFATPAIAAPREAPPVAAAPGNAADIARPVDAKAKRYCVRDTVTGSRIRRTVCQTRAAWMLDGFDPLTAK